MWLRWWVLMRLYYYHHLPVNIWYLDAELGISLLDRCGLVILLTSCRCRTDGMAGGAAGCNGKPGRYRWPSSPPHQLHQQHATRIMGPTHPLLWQELTCPQAPQNNRAHPAASCVETTGTTGSLMPEQIPVQPMGETSRSLGLWHFINNGINNYCSR